MTTRSPFRSMVLPLLAAVAMWGSFGGVARAADVPFLSGRVNDNAGILSAGTARDLEEILRKHEDSTSNQVAVLTIATLEGEPLEDYSRRVVMTWKLGQKGKDNGVLLLVVKDDRKVRIEVGRGLEGQLTDAVASTIIRHEILPQFKSGDYDRGVQAGVEAIIGAIAGAYTADENDTAPPMGTGTGILAFLFFLLVVGIFTLIAFGAPGGGGWFLYVFLLPFWGLFPSATLGSTVGLPMFYIYAIGMPIAKIIAAHTAWGKKFAKKYGMVMTSSGGGGWSSGGGSSSSSSSSSSFSGGGGSFSGGGSSGSW